MEHLTETPVLDFVALTYSTSYQTSGYIQLRSNYYSGTAPVAITAYWNATTPSGTGLQVEFQRYYYQDFPIQWRNKDGFNDYRVHLRLRQIHIHRS